MSCSSNRIILVHFSRFIEVLNDGGCNGSLCHIEEYGYYRNTITNKLQFGTRCLEKVCRAFERCLSRMDPYFLSQLEDPAFKHLAEVGCASTIANHWRAMRHRLRRRLERQRVASMKTARTAKVAKTAAIKGTWRSQVTGNGHETTGSPRLYQATLTSLGFPVPEHSTARASSAIGTELVIDTGNENGMKIREDHPDTRSMESQDFVPLADMRNPSINTLTGSESVEPPVKRTRLREPCESRKNLGSVAK